MKSLEITGADGTNANVTGSGTNSAGTAPTVSNISASTANLGTNAIAIEIQAGTVQLSAAAAGTSNHPVAWQWLYSVDGSAQSIYQMGTGTSPISSFNYTPDVGGFTYNWTLVVTDTRTGVSSQTQTNIYVQVPGTQILQIIPH